MPSQPGLASPAPAGIGRSVEPSLAVPVLAGIAGAVVGALTFALLAHAVLHDDNIYRSYAGVVGLLAGFLAGLGVALPDRFAAHAWTVEAAGRRLRRLRWLAYALAAVSGLAGLALVLLLEDDPEGALGYLLGVPVAVVGSGLALRWFGRLRLDAGAAASPHASQ